MQIVIDIPEKEFGIEIEDKFQDFFKRLEVETKEHMISGTNLLCGAYELETIQMLMQALAKGTPLPKGHGRLIDADKAVREENSKLVDFETTNTRDRSYCRYARMILNDAPTIIEADEESE